MRLGELAAWKAWWCLAGREIMRVLGGVAAFLLLVFARTHCAVNGMVSERSWREILGL